MQENGKTLKRKDWKGTKTGFTLYTKNKRDWKIEYPDGDKRYGRTQTSKLVIFFLCLDMGHSLKKARRIAFKETRTK